MSKTVKEHEAMIRESIDPLLAGEAVGPIEMADRAAYSRYHFHRVFKRIMGETPGGMRRRLLLERAAWLLSKDGLSSTESAFEAGFESLDGFGRAFRKAFGVLPSRFAQSEIPVWLPTPNGVHFSPLVLMPTGGKTMDLIDRLLDHDLYMTKKLLKGASLLSAHQLDAPLPSISKPLCWEEANSLRDLLHQMILAKEVWVAAVEKQGFPAEGDRSVEAIISRAEVACPMFDGLVRRVRDANEWDTKFVDELCEQPVPFTFGGMIAHVLTFGIYRRQLAIETMKRLGVDVGFGDPLGWEQDPAGAYA